MLRMPAVVAAAKLTLPERRREERKKEGPSKKQLASTLSRFRGEAVAGL
jgi:hypothetical protein